ncbi:Imm42 family immunity protein [Paraburkholderia sp. J94]|uniref:Imm42 family immunity protein n=1 Tax=Paraburkholderia sp. J94 TaxID=2805441 RepID=UPI002AB2A2F2|nr:Imm42 family immunity protein [Paraburkholderia sp. J94]
MFKAELNEHSGGSWMFGRFCYWIGGEQVGAFDEGVSLRDVLFSMQYIIGDSGKRTAPLLAYCDKNEIFRVIQESLSESGNDLAKLTPTDFMPACFDVCRHVDIFGAWQVYLVDSQDLSKLVYSPDSGNNVKIVELATGEFDAIASSIYTELDNLLDACQ